MARVQRTGAQKGIAKGLDDRRERVELDQRAVALGDGRDGVDDRGGVHPQLHAKTHQVAQVAVAGGERADDDAKTQAKTGHHQQQQRGEQHIQVGPHRRSAQGEVAQEEQKQTKLDAEGDQVRDQDADRHRQAREVDLAKQTGVADKGVRGLVQAFGEVAPDDRARHVEQEGGQPVGGQPGDVAEDDGEDQGGQHRLDQVPQRAEDGLFVDRDEIAAHKQQHQVAVAPQLAQAQIEPAALRADDQVPFLFVWQDRGRGVRGLHFFDWVGFTQFLAGYSTSR